MLLIQEIMNISEHLSHVLRFHDVPFEDNVNITSLSKVLDVKGPSTLIDPSSFSAFYLLIFSEIHHKVIVMIRKNT